jgi:hypothetical protein
MGVIDPNRSPLSGSYTAIKTRDRGGKSIEKWQPDIVSGPYGLMMRSRSPSCSKAAVIAAADILNR